MLNVVIMQVGGHINLKPNSCDKYIDLFLGICYPNDLINVMKQNKICLVLNIMFAFNYFNLKIIKLLSFIIHTHIKYSVLLKNIYINVIMPLLINLLMKT